MKRFDLADLLHSNDYPGRGIVLGKTPDGQHAAIAYFIMGRSVNSRNRVFVSQPDGGIITRAYDESKMTDPSLIIYAPIRVPEKGTWIVTNGDQTDTVRDFLNKGSTFEDALRTRTFEPDPPNYTPRISGLLTVKNSSMSYKLSILKSDNGNAESVQRFFYEYEQPAAGEGHFIHTYRCNGNPIPSFKGEPEWVSVENSFDTFTDRIWQNLNPENRVSLFTAFVNIDTGDLAASRIINRNAE
ncbi:MAG: IMP cyclohydrolase [Clostridia bacterium]|nr:IMP cyclohydrolase [Clostridia bacterium]